MADIMLRDGSITHDPRVDAMVLFDERSLEYPASAVLPTTEQVFSMLWDIDIVLDQMREGACVGCGVTHELACTPIPYTGLDFTFAKEVIYWGAQRKDPWEGGDYPGATPRYSGTATVTGLEVARELGLISEYRWNFSASEARQSLLHLAPLVVATEWREGMYQTDVNGRLHVTGDLVGRHCYLIIGYDAPYDEYIMLNSWGPGFGDNGRARIAGKDFAGLLERRGEAAVVTDIPQTRPTPEEVFAKMGLSGGGGVGVLGKLKQYGGAVLGPGAEG